MKKEIEETVRIWQRDNRIRNLSEESLESYDACAKDFLRYFSAHGIWKFRQLTEEVIKDYTFSQLQRNCSARTVNNRLKALRRVCHYYESELKPGFNIPQITLQREEMTCRKPLTDEEVCKIAANFSPDNPDSVLVAFVLDTGARSKSVRNVRMEDLDFDRGIITLRVTKNRDVLRIPMSMKLSELLRQYVRINKIKEGYLFRCTDKETMFTRSTVYKLVKRYLNHCGVDKSGVHLFRYTFGKIMIENNCNAMLLQKWLGHRTMEETKKYVRLYSDELKTVCEQVTPLAQYGKILKKLSSECLL
jgi:integrase/recombinase XerD